MIKKRLKICDRSIGEEFPPLVIAEIGINHEGSLKTAIELVNTLIREKFISTLQHAADMGIELHKAELSLKYGFKYIQDKDLNIDK